MVYVFDSSSFRVLGNYYPERFPSFWVRFEALVAAGTVVSVRDVYGELERWTTEGWLWDWIQAHRRIFLIPESEETEFVSEIMKVPHFHSLVGKTQRLRGQAAADPWIVACAKIRQGCVVTEEAKKPNAAKIPNVCDHFDVECTNVQGFLARNGWQF